MKSGNSNWLLLAAVAGTLWYLSRPAKTPTAAVGSHADVDDSDPDAAVWEAIYDAVDALPLPRDEVAVTNAIIDVLTDWERMDLLSTALVDFGFTL